MYKKRWYISLICIAIAVAIISCGGSNKGNGYDDVEEYDASAASLGDVNYDPAAMESLIMSFSSPVETAALLEKSGVPFNRNFLINPDDVSDYSTSFKKALGLGVLSADLGYLNVYSQTSEVVDYLASIRKLSEDLKVGQFFDFQSLKRLATSSSNDDLDSLLFMCVDSYHKMTENLVETRRSHLSVLLVTGVWVESVYILTQVAQKNGGEDFKDQIGEQKNILKDLLPIIKLFAADKSFENLIQDLEELKDVFDVVKITTQVEGDAKMEIVNGVAVINQNETSVVTMSNEEFQEIIRTTEKIRNKLIAL